MISKRDEILFNIERSLSDYYSSKRVVSLDYKIGYVLFLAYYSLEREGLIKKVNENLKECIEFMTSDFMDSSLFNGFTGLAWLIQHLRKKGNLIDYDSTVLDGLDEYILTSAINDGENYDLLYGLIGKGIYFLERYPSSNSKLALTEISQLIIKLPNIGIQSYFKNTTLPKNIDRSVNLGLAHGIPSIISFLSLVHQKGINQDNIKPVLTKAIDKLLSEELKDQPSSFSVNSTSHTISRLAWCYGDLGVAIALHHASTALDDKSLENKAKQVVIKSTKRKLKDSGVVYTKDKLEKGFCHGASGLSHIYFKFSKKFNCPEINSTLDYWNNILHKNIVANARYLNIYKYNNSNSLKQKWVFDAGLVDGLSGIGLVMMSQKNANIKHSWDNVFLTNI